MAAKVGSLNINNMNGPIPANDEVLFLGVDGGGSKCRAIVATATKTLGVGLSGPANPLHGVEQSTASIIEASERALQDAGLNGQLSELIAGVGLAGVNMPQCFKAIKDWQHPFKQMFVTTDLRIACLGAHDGDDGAVIIAGTGSSAYVRVKGREYAYGGHGFPHGDKGSGAWIGLEAIKYVLLALDDMASKSRLSEKVLQYLNCSDATGVVESLMPIGPSQFASVAPLVFEVAALGDEVAGGIIKEAAQYMSAMSRRLLALKPPKLSVLGGLSHLITPWLDSDILPYIKLASSPPEDGAIYFAKQELQAQQKTV